MQLPAEADESSQLPTAKSSPSCNADVDMHQDDDDNVDFGNGIDHSMFEDDETEDDVEEAAEIETSTVDLQVPVPLSSEQRHTSSIKPVASSSEQRDTSPVKTISSKPRPSSLAPLRQMVHNHSSIRRVGRGHYRRVQRRYLKSERKHLVINMLMLARV